MAGVVPPPAFGEAADPPPSTPLPHPTHQSTPTTTFSMLAVFSYVPSLASLAPPAVRLRRDSGRRRIDSSNSGEFAYRIRWLISALSGVVSGCLRSTAVRRPPSHSLCRRRGFKWPDGLRRVTCKHLLNFRLRPLGFAGSCNDKSSIWCSYKSRKSQPATTSSNDELVRLAAVAAAAANLTKTRVATSPRG